MCSIIFALTVEQRLRTSRTAAHLSHSLHHHGHLAQ